MDERVEDGNLGRSFDHARGEGEAAEADIQLVRGFTFDTASRYVQCTGYSYCHDHVYRLLSIANCQAIVVAATKLVPRAEVLRHDRTSMTLAFSSPDVDLGVGSADDPS